MPAVTQNKSTQTINWLNVIRLAGAYCAFCIGAGFASGQEILQFFTAHGTYSFGALLISMILFMWMGAALMSAGQRLKLPKTTDIFKQFCGPYFGRFLEFLVPFFLFCVIVIMIAGSGAMLNEFYGLHPYVGRILMAVASLFTVILGLSRLISVIGFIGPVIIIFSIFAGIMGISDSPLTLVEIETVAQQLNLASAKADPYWWKSGILYASFMIFGSAPFFTGIGAEASNKKEAILGGLAGGFFLLLAAGIMSTGMLFHLTDVFDKEMPILALVAQSSKYLATAFSLILLFGIYTTAAPMLWTICNRVCQDKSPKFTIVAIVLATLALIGGMLPFGKLVGTIYPYTGYIGIAFIVCIVFSQLTTKKL